MAKAAALDRVRGHQRGSCASMHPTALEEMHAYSIQQIKSPPVFSSLLSEICILISSGEYNP